MARSFKVELARFKEAMKLKREAATMIVSQCQVTKH